MKVRELIAKLSEIENQDAEVVMSKDGEGNNFSPFSDCGLGIYIPDSTWAGDVYNSREEYCEDGNELPDNVQDCVVLWPVN